MNLATLVFVAGIVLAIALIWAVVSCDGDDCRRFRALRLRLRAHLKIGDLG
ncbi:hypothetical protein RA307_09970 [Xanthobacteraceae bacterium Astr-EGSB]|uniref:hypothetical protein n=1 Tax=Astrobacterium formosum TaxID=3069710 RepID=UPI0027B3218D|nr:hypothetical protein [Xanthobacteraceae bacterium Astr-EGSB]